MRQIIELEVYQYWVDLFWIYILSLDVVEFTAQNTPNQFVLLDILLQDSFSIFFYFKNTI